MNKVYKIVWNTSLGAWVAVSELAKSKTKTKTVGSASLITAMILFAPNAFAASGIDGGTGTGTSISPSASICNGALGVSPANSGTNGANIAIGCNANASGGTRSVVIGDNAAVGSNTSQSVAVGSVAVARGDQSVAMGNNVNANGNSSIAIGGDDINKVRSAYNTNYKTITGVDLPTGYPETTAAGGGAVVVGVTAKATGNFSSAYGMAANAIGDASVALGTTANAGGQGALAIGAVSSASNTGSVAIGINSLSSGVNSTAIGSGSTAATGSQAKGDNATAIGAASVASTSGTALGQSANAADSATAIGIRSSATQAGGVAIGSDSVANTAGSVAGYDPITGQGSTSTTGAWKSTNAAVAVGNGSSVTRQITGLAAGTQDTDAVNIAQLKAVKNYTDKLANSTATSLGGGSKLDTTTGSISTPAYGITKTDGTSTTVNGVGNAITALNNEVIKPITFQGNNGSTSKALGSTLTISGGASSTTSTSNTNVKTQVSGDGNTIDVQFANAPVFSGTVTANGFNATNNKITNVADGTVSSTSKDAINGSQLNTTNSNVTNAQNTANTAVTNAATAQKTADQGISLADNNGKATNKKLGDTFTIKGTGTKADTEYSAGNVKTTTDSNGNLLVNLDKNSTFDSITTGNSKLNNDGLTITNGPSITASGGVNAGSKKVLNVTAGDVSSSSTDAINGSQLNTTNNNVTDAKNAAVAAQTTADQGISLADNNGKATNKKLGDTFTIKGTGTKADTEYSAGNVKTTTDSNGNLLVNLDKNSTFDSITTGNSKLNNDGLTITNGPSVTSSGINAANKKITNVAAGDVSSSSTDAINGSQLNTTNNNVTDAKNAAVAAQTTADQGISLADNNGKATNKKLGDTFTIKGTGTKADTEYSAENVKTTTDSNGNLLVNLDKNSTFDSITTGNSKLNNDGLTITNGPSVTSSGINAANKKITNVAAGDVSSSSTDAINGSQLNQTNQLGLNFSDTNNKVTHKNLGETLGINGAGTKADDQYSASNIKTTTDANGNIIVGIDQNSNFQTVTATDTNGNNSILSGTGTAVSSKDGKTKASYTLTGSNLSDAQGNTSTTDIGGTTLVSKDANNNITSTAKYGVNTASITDNSNNSNVLTSTQSQLTDQSKATNTSTASNNILASSDGKTKTTTIAGNTDYTDGTNNVSVGNSGLSVNNGSNNSTVTATGLTVNNGPSVTTTGINAASMKVTNVADGAINSTSKDAINGSQLYTTQNDLTNKGLNFSADTGGSVSRKLGDTLSIKGGADTTKLTDNNIGVVADQTNGLTVKLAQNIDLSNQGSLTIGNSKVDTTGITTTDSQNNKTVNAATGTTVTDGNGRSNTIQANNSTIKDGNGNTTVTQTTGVDVSDSSSNNNAITSQGSTVTDGNNNKSISTASGLTTTNGDSLAHTNSFTATSSKLSDNQANTNVSTASQTQISDGNGRSNTIQADNSTIKDANGNTTITRTTGVNVSDSSNNNNAITSQGSTVTDGNNNKSVSTASGLTTTNGDSLAHTNSFTATSSKLSDNQANTTDMKATGISISDGNSQTNVLSANSSTLQDANKNTNVDTATSNIITSGDGKTKTTTTAGNTVYTDGTSTTNVGSTGLRVTNGPSVTTTGIDAASMKVTNVADGAINSTSKDAINGSQLYATQNDLTNKGLNFSADSGANVARKLGDTLSITGGADTTKLTKNNIGVVSNGSDGLEVQLTKDVNLGSDGSLTVGNTALNNGGLTTTDANGNTATLTGSGTAIQGKDGSSANYGLGGTTLKDTSGNTNSTTPTGSTVTDQAGNTTVVSAAGTTVTAKDADGKTTGQATYGADGLSFKDGTGTSTGPSVSNTGISAGNAVISNVKDGVAPTDAANKGQVDAMGASLTNKGLNFSADSGANVARKLGDTLSITGGADTTKLTKNNIGVVSNGSDGLEVQLTKDVNLGSDGSLTVGNTALNNGGLTTTDANGNTATLTGSGTAIQGKDGSSANYGLGGTTLKDTSGNTNSTTPTGSTVTDQAGNTTVVSAAGTTVTAKDADGKTTGQATYGADGLSFKDGTGTSTGPSVSNTGISAGNAVISNVKDGVAPTDAANKGQVDAMGASLTNKGLNFSADSGANVARKLGDTLSITGGADTTKLTKNNIGVVSNGSDGLEVQLTKDVNLGSDGSLTVGNTALNNGGLTTTDANGNTATLTGSGTAIQGKDGSSANYGLGGTTLKDTSGNTNSTTPTGSTVTDQAGNTTVVSAAGTTVTAKDADGKTTGQATYGADGLSFKDGTGTSTGPSVSNTGISAGNAVISNVKDGVAPTDAANKGQVDAMGASLTNKGLNFSADSGANVARKLGDTLSITGGADTTKLTKNNIGVVSNGSDGLEVQLTKDVNLGSDGSLTVGNTALNNGGLTTTDANGNTATLTGSGTAIQGKDGSSANYGLGGTTLKDTSGNTNSTTPTGSTVTDQAGNTTVVSAAGTTVTAKDADGKTTGQATYGADGLSFKDGTGTSTGPSVSNTGISAGNAVISNVKDGVAPTDAANKGQVDAMGASLTNKGLNFSADSGANVARKLGDTLSITGGADTTKLTKNNIGVVSNGSDGLEVQLTKDVNLGSDGSLTVGNTALNNGGLTTTDANGNTATLTGSGTAIQGKDGSSANYGADGLSFKDGTGTSTGPSVSNTGISAGNAVISNVKDGVAPTDAANKGQVDAMGASLTNKGLNFSADSGANVARKLGDTLSITGGADTTKLTKNNIGVVSNGSDGLEVQLTKDVDLGSDGSIKTGNMLLNTNGMTITNGPSVTVAGINAGNEKITNVVDGIVSPTSKDAVNGSQLYTATTDMANKGLDFTDSNGTVTHKNLGETLAIKGTGTKSDNEYDTDNLKTMTDANGNIIVGLDKNATFNSLNVGGTTVNSNGLTIVNGPSMTNSGINAAGTKVTNVANGTDSTDAVNKSQLDALATNISNSVTNVTDGNGNKVNVTNEVVNTAPNNNNTASMFLTYDKNGQGTTDRLTIGQTVQKMNTEGVKYAHTYNDTTAGVLGATNDSSAGGKGSTAIGVNAIVDTGADNSIALGKNTSAVSTATNSVVIGNSSSVKGTSSVAIGDGAVAAGNQSISVGTGNQVNGNNSGAFGDPSTVTGNESYVLGNNNTVSTDNTFVVGNNVKTTTAGSVVLGNSSAARTGAGVNGYVPMGATTSDQNAINATTSTTGAVAVGDAQSNIYRQITGVAAGTADSDAVNVAQLKAVDNKILALHTQGNTISDGAGNTNISNATGNIISGNTTNGGTSTSNTTNAGMAVTAKDANGNVVNNASYGASQASWSDAKGNTTTAQPTGISVTSKDSSGNTTAANYGANGAQYTNSDGSGSTVGANGIGFTDKNGNATGPSITASGLDAGSQKVTNVADGAVTSTSKDAVNGSQLYSVQSQLDSLKTSGNTITDSNGNSNQSTATGNTVKDASGNANQTTATSNTLTGKDTAGNIISSTTTAGGTTVSTKDSSGNVINNANYTSTQASLSDAKGNSATTTASGTTYTGADKTSSTINNNGLSFKDASGNATGPSVTSSGIDAGNQKVTNVANGGISSTSKDGVNGSQVYAANASIAAALGGSAAVNADGTLSSPTYKVANSSYNNVGDALTAVDNRVGNVENNLNQAFAYTNNRINKLEDKLSSGIAATAALEQAPYVAGKWTYAAGASYYNNQGAVGATLRRTADNGRWSMSGGVAGGNNGSPLFRVGISGVID